MNDRLADLGDDVPSWALEDSSVNNNSSTTTPLASNNNNNNHDGDIELGSGGWMNQSDDFQVSEQAGDPTQQQQIDEKKQQSEHIMEQFFSYMDIVTNTISEVTNSTKRIKQMDEKTKLSVNESEEKRMSQEIKTLIQKTNVEAKKAKHILGLLRSENKKYEAEKTINVSDLRYDDIHVLLLVFCCSIIFVLWL